MLELFNCSAVGVVVCRRRVELRPAMSDRWLEASRVGVCRATYLFFFMCSSLVLAEKVDDYISAQLSATYTVV